MRVESVRYEKLINLGNYSNEKIGVTVVLEPDESPSESLAPKPSDYEILEAEKMVSNPDNYAPRLVRKAEELLSLASGTDDIPF